MDKRDLHRAFQGRLHDIIVASGQSKGGFAHGLGIDRSALSQILDAGSVRLPRVETLAKMAQMHNVSLDWLLGLSESGQKDTEVKNQFELEQAPPEKDASLLSHWRMQALGQKIRYIPFQLPDIFCLPEVFKYQMGFDAERIRHVTQAAEDNVSYVERPDTDMEIIMPLQRLQSLIAGKDVWDAVPASIRARQICHIERLIDEFYPTVRLFLVDGLKNYAAPVTIFGNMRAAFYLGGKYMVLTGGQSVKQTMGYFDDLIRAAVVHPHEVSAWIKNARAGLEQG